MAEDCGLGAVCLRPTCLQAGLDDETARCRGPGLSAVSSLARNQAAADAEPLEREVPDPVVRLDPGSEARLGGGR